METTLQVSLQDDDDIHNHVLLFYLQICVLVKCYAVSFDIWRLIRLNFWEYQGAEEGGEGGGAGGEEFEELEEEG